MLVKWTKDDEDDSTWEDAEKLLEAYPELELEDKHVVKEGSNDTRYDITYHRRKPKAWIVMFPFNIRLMCWYFYLFNLGVKSL